MTNCKCDDVAMLLMQHHLSLINLVNYQNHSRYKSSQSEKNRTKTIALKIRKKVELDTTIDGQYSIYLNELST